MAKTTVYQFIKYDMASDNIVKSRRWGTREGIEWLQGTVLEGTATEVDESLVGHEIEGLTDIGFNPHAQKGPQTQVTS